MSWSLFFFLSRYWCKGRNWKIALLFSILTAICVSYCTDCTILYWRRGRKPHCSFSVLHVLTSTV